MLKKIILAVLLSGFIGVLVWGGVNRTQAKSNDSDGRDANNQNATLAEYSEGNGVQPRGNSDHETFSDEEGHQGYGNGQTDTGSQIESRAIAENQAETGGQGNGNRGGSDPLTTTEIEALNLALNDEFHALAVYQSVMATFGEVEPFVEIAVSEQRHIDALINQFNKHGLLVPENPWIGNVPTYDSLQQACQAGVEAEIANTDLYDKLFSMTDDPRLTQVFTNLSSASWNSHLPQFEACQ
jgi:hypothetical protein